MSKNLLSLKIASPYARALLTYSVEQNVLYQITADFNNLNNFFCNTPELVKYLSSPVVSKQAKMEILKKTLQSNLSKETFKFLMILINRDRINLLTSVIQSYLDLIYEIALIKDIEIATAFPFNKLKKNNLIKKLKKITNAREIRLFITHDSNLIGGFLIKTKSKIVNFTIKNKLQNLAKHLGNILEI